MNFLYAKVKRKAAMCRVLSADTEIYPVPSSLTGIEYDPNTLLEDGELYKISNFSTTAFSISFLTDEVDSVSFDQATTTELKSLSYVCAVQGDQYFFQIINSSFFVNKKWFAISEPSLETDKPIIVINNNADCIYDKPSDTLYFKKLSVANRLFKGMDQLYREATEQETTTFLQSDFLDVEPDYSVGNVSIPNRKRIALVTETLSRMSDPEKQAIHQYITEYASVPFADGKFKIETDDNLKYVLWGIEQRFYTTPIGGEKRVANSIIQI